MSNLHGLDVNTNTTVHETVQKTEDKNHKITKSHNLMPDLLFKA